jgi:hypothetical protein
MDGKELFTNFHAISVNRFNEWEQTPYRGLSYVQVGAVKFHLDTNMDGLD